MADWPPLKNSAFTVIFPIYDADGDLVSAAASLDSEVSIDEGTFSDVAAEATELATSSGMYSLALTDAEMDGDRIATITKTGTAGAKTAVNVMYTATRQLIDLAYPATAGRSILVEADGMVSADMNEWRGVQPAALASGSTVQADVERWREESPNVLLTGRVDSNPGAMQANVLTAAAIAANAFGADELAADAVNEIVDAIWDEDIEAAHGTDATAGLLLRVLGSAISDRVNNPTLDAVLGVADVAGRDVPAQTWLETTRDLTQLGFTLAEGDFATGFLTAALIATDAIGSAEFADTARDKIVDQVWEEAASDHLVSGSFGGRVDSLWKSNVAVEGAVNEAGGTSILFSTDLAEATDNHFRFNWLIFTSGALSGQARPVRAYTGFSGSCAFDRAYTDAPSNGDAFTMLAVGNPALDVMLGRLSDVEDESSVTTSNRMLLWAIAKLANKVDFAATPGTIFKTDDVTTLFQQAITEDAGANPITVLDTS